MKIEAVIRKRTLNQFKDKENPWKHRSFEERLNAMAVICGTQDDDGKAQQRFSRVYSIVRKTSG